MRAVTNRDRYSECLDTIAECGRSFLDGPQQVGRKAPNPWGLDRIRGEFDEWVQDWCGADRGGSG